MVRVGIPLYPDFDSLDVLGPYQVFFFCDGIEPFLIGDAGVTSIEGVRFQPPCTYEDNPDMDVLFVPGTSVGVALSTLQTNQRLLSYLGCVVETLRARPDPGWPRITSVCAGSLLLAAIGALDGRCVTTHWLMRDALRDLPNVTLAAGYPRYVHDRDVMTGGGISSGIDEALALAGLITNFNQAATAQLIMQYRPRPDFDAGDPSVAPPELVAPLRASSQSDVDQIAKILQQAGSTR